MSSASSSHPDFGLIWRIRDVLRGGTFRNSVRQICCSTDLRCHGYKRIATTAMFLASHTHTHIFFLLKRLITFMMTCWCSDGTKQRDWEKRVKWNWERAETVSVWGGLGGGVKPGDQHRVKLHNSLLILHLWWEGTNECVRTHTPCIPLLWILKAGLVWHVSKNQSWTAS